MKCINTTMAAAEIRYQCSTYQGSVPRLLILMSVMIFLSPKKFDFFDKYSRCFDYLIEYS